jgi:26S proteasome regulatory subunit N10
VEVLVSPTENIGKILASFAAIKSEGAPELSTSVSIAQLALRHRKNKNGGQRIIIFIGSPVLAEERELKKMGSLLKKNNIAVDVVVMGEHDQVQDKMAELVNAANTNDNR